MTRSPSSSRQQIGPRTTIPRIAAQYEGLNLEYVETNPHAEGGVGAAYIEKFPLGLVPGLEHGELKLTESIAISSYLASLENKANLLGQTKEQAADVLRWASWANADLISTLVSWFAPLTGSRPYQKPQVEAAKEKTLKHLAYLEKALSTRTFLVGERITLADIYVAEVLSFGQRFVLDAEFRKAHPNTLRFWNTVVRQQPYTAVIGAFPTQIETAIVYTPPKKETKPKAEQPAAAPKPKAPAPAAEEEDKPAEPKAKHPCEALGPAKSFPMDEWKRQYSNNDTPVAMKWLDEHYNANDYSIVRCDFKYNEELTQTFMSANQCTGFHTRLEASRKYLFGSLNVYGTSGNSKIIGVYMIRGNDWKAVFDVAPDYESYNFTTLDYKTDRELIEKVWSWEGEVEGLTVADGKIFK
ncbi:elongation factor 1-gamma [Rhodotorula toruloides]|uniref:Elongation factor 1-gamma n=1 Tax=Rhodotorula toruloides TaxID=5286 RepID=A0A511KI87_RHOTO|nr:elongation factor 1-gamma [Rhodotorula toruloides]